MMKLHKKEKGQSLLILAFVIFAGVVMLVLVIDGGMLLMNRRVAQTAADAGAYAGAYYKCTHDNPADAEVEVKAKEYAINQNGADEADVEVDPDTGEVTVTTRVRASTFFGNIINRSETEASAIAAARCFTPSGGNLLPIAFYCDAMLDPDTGDYSCEFGDNWFEEFDKEAYLNDPGYPGPDEIDDPDMFEKLYLILDTDKYCNDITENDPDKLDCDIDGDGIKEILSNGDRGWLNLDGGSGSASELVDWIENGYSGNVVAHTWYPLTGGNISSAYMSDALVEELVFVPIVDWGCTYMPVGDDPDDACVSAAHGQYDPDYIGPETDTVVDGVGANYVHMVGVGAFFVTCVDAGSVGNDDCPLHNKTANEGFIKNNDNTIEGFFVGGEIYLDNISSVLGSVDTGVYTIKLTR